MKIVKELLEQHYACSEGIKWAEQQGLIGQELEPFITALMAEEKYSWSVWLLTRLMNREQCLLLAINSAEIMLPVFEAEYPLDTRPREAIEAAREYIQNPSVTTYNAVEDAAIAASDAARAAADAKGAARAKAAAADAAAARASFDAARAVKAARAARDADSARAAYDSASAARAAADAARAAYDNSASAAATYVLYATFITSTAPDKFTRDKIISYGLNLLEGGYENN